MAKNWKKGEWLNEGKKVNKKGGEQNNTKMINLLLK